jgi:hypothetical protein
MADQLLHRLWARLKGYQTSGLVPFVDTLQAVFAREIVDKNNTSIFNGNDLNGVPLIDPATGKVAGALTAVSHAVILSSPGVLAAGMSVQADTTTAPFTQPLPATAKPGDRLEIEDAKMTWDNHNLTLSPAGGLLIAGANANYVASVRGNKLTVTYIDNAYGWSIK